MTRFFRAAAVVSSVLLLVLYVYDRAGGNVLSKWRDGTLTGPSEPAQPSHQELMYSSKSGPVVAPSVTNEGTAGAKNDTFLPGSKVDVPVFVIPENTAPSKGQRMLLPGSKSGIAVAPVTSGEEAATFQPTEFVVPKTKGGQPTFLPGSKAPIAPVVSPPQAGK